MEILACSIDKEYRHILQDPACTSSNMSTLFRQNNQAGSKKPRDGYQDRCVESFHGVGGLRGLVDARAANEKDVKCELYCCCYL